AGKANVGLHQRLRPDNEIHLARGDLLQRATPLLLGKSAGQEQSPHTAEGKITVECAGVLCGKDLGRRHQGSLVLVGNRDEQGIYRDSSLASANVGLDETLHRPALRQVAADIRDCFVLVLGQSERQQASDALVDHGAARQHGGLLPVAYLAASQGEGKLQQQQFLVDKAATGLLGAGQVSGAVDLVQGTRRVEEVVLPAPPL